MQTKQLLLGVMWFTIGHLFVFFQLNGQFFKTDWFRKNEMIVALFGFIISFFIFGELNTQFKGLMVYYGQPGL